MSLQNIASKITKIIQILTSKECECLCDEKYHEIIDELNESINKLVEWAKKAGIGDLNGSSS